MWKVLFCLLAALLALTTAQTATTTAMAVMTTASGESSSGETSSSETSSETSSSETSSESSSSETSSESSSSETSSESSSETGSTSLPASTSSTQHRNDVSCNYYYGSFDTSHFAYAVGQCSQYSILNGQVIMPTCVDANTIQIDLYYGDSCSGTATTTTYTSDEATFFCGGVNAYASITISPNACPASYTIYSAINTCTNATSSIWSSVYCTSTSGEIQYYLDNTCSDDYFYSLAKFNKTCGYMFTTAKTSTDIYGKLNECNTAGSTATTSTPATTAKGSASINHINKFVLLCVGLLYILQF